MDKMNTLLTGTAGIATTAVVQNAAPDYAAVANTALTAVIQIVIAVVTILGLFKKPKNNV